MSDLTLITGGAGYVGAEVALALLDAGREVRVLDSLLHGQDEIAKMLDERGADVRIGDIRDEGARRSAVEGAGAIVHLAAIVGDPACARDPELASEPGRSEARLKVFVTQPQFVDWVLQTLRHESRIRQLETRQRGVFAPEGADR